MREITATELKAWLDNAQSVQPFLLDVREPSEFALCHLPGATLLPMRSVPSRLDELPHDAPIVCICHHGMRSMQVALFLSSRGFENVSNLSGGVHSWAQAVDPTMPTY